MTPGAEATYADRAEIQRIVASTKANGHGLAHSRA